MSDFRMTPNGTVHNATQCELIDAPGICKPVFVVDPEDYSAVDRLLGAMYDGEHGQDDVSNAQVALRSLIAPPKPDEPTGLGAVIEDADGRLWTRPNDAGEWFSSDGEEVHTAYAALDAVRVLSQGVDQ